MRAAVVELAEQLGGRLSACTGLKLDLPTVCHYSVPVKEGGKKEANDRVQVKQGESGTIASQWRGDDWMLPWGPRLFSVVLPSFNPLH